MKKSVLLPFLAMSILGCSEEPLKEYSKLESLRILDISVDIQETNQLDTNLNFTLTPLLSDVGGTGVVNLKWDICLDPGLAFGAAPVCPGDAVSQQVHTFVSTMRTETGAAQVKTFNMSSTVFAKSSAAQQFNGVTVLVTLEASSGTETVRSLKRILYTSKTASLNNNPSLTGFLIDGAAWTGLPTAKSSLTPILGTGSQESYQFKTENGDTVSLEEELQVTWFSASGKWTRTRTLGAAANAWTPTTTTPGVVVLVLRDGRGGSSSFIREY